MSKIVLKIREKFKHTMLAFCEDNHIKAEFSEKIDENGKIETVVLTKKAEALFVEKYKKILEKYGLRE